jgi:hypothetical protein
MSYAIQTTFDRFAPFLELKPQKKEQKLEVLIAATLNKLKGRQIPVCTTLVVDDLIEQKLVHSDQFLRRPENRYLPASYLDRLRKGREKHQVQFRGGLPPLSTR